MESVPSPLSNVLAMEKLEATMRSSMMGILLGRMLTSICGTHQQKRFGVKMTSSTMRSWRNTTTKKCTTMVIWFQVCSPQDCARSHLELGSTSGIGILVLTSKNFESSINAALAIVLVGKNSFLTLKLVRFITLSPSTYFSHLVNVQFSKISWPRMMKISWRVDIHCQA